MKKALFVFWTALSLAACSQQPHRGTIEAPLDIVYIYIASESSPKETWENMIPDLKGEHYRLSEKQWNYLGNVFNIEGVPTYMIVDPEGNICWKTTGFSGTETMKVQLLKAMGE